MTSYADDILCMEYFSDTTDANGDITCTLNNFLSFANSGGGAWTKRQTVTITENSGADLTDFQVELTVTYDSDMQADFDDLRFADLNGNVVPHWIEEYTASTSATVWVKVSLPASGTTDIYMYYGNSLATDGSDGDSVFEFFDNFPGPTMDGSKWTLNARGSITETVSDYCRITNAADGGAIDHLKYWNPNNDANQHQSSWTPTTNAVVEWKTSMANTVANDEGGAGLGFYNGTSRVMWMGLKDNASGGVECYLRALDETTFGAVFASESLSVLTDYDFKIVKVGTSYEVFRDGVSKGSDTIAVAPTKLSIGAPKMWPNGFPDYVQLENVRVRQYASSEPTAAFGSESSKLLGAFPMVYTNTSEILAKVQEVDENVATVRFYKLRYDRTDDGISDTDTGADNLPGGVAAQGAKQNVDADATSTQNSFGGAVAQNAGTGHDHGVSYQYYHRHNLANTTQDVVWTAQATTAVSCILVYPRDAT